MVAICDHSLLLLWALLLLLAVLAIIIIDLPILLRKVILLFLKIINILIIIILWTLYFMLTVYYFILFVVVDILAVSSKKSVTVCSLWWMFWVLFVKFVLAGIEFWQVYRLFVLKCFWRVVVFWWWGNLVRKKFAFVVFVVPLILLHWWLATSMWLLVLIQQGHQFLLLFFYILLQYLSRQVTPENLLYLRRCLVLSLKLLPNGWSQHFVIIDQNILLAYSCQRIINSRWLLPTFLRLFRFSLCLLCGKDYLAVEAVFRLWNQFIRLKSLLLLLLP